MTTHPSDYSIAFSVDRTGEEVFDAITDVRGWWSHDVVGDSDRLGAEFRYRFQDAHRCTLRVTQLDAGRRVVWHVVDNYFNFVDDQDEWKGTDLVFDIEDNGQATTVRFTHVGLAAQLECYDVCSNAWGGYINGSLKQLILTGQGQPNPKEGGTPEHQDTANRHRADRYESATASEAGPQPR